MEWRVVEGSVVGSAGYVVHVDVHGEWVMLWVAAMYNVLAILSMAGLFCLYEAWTVLALYGMLDFLMLTDMAAMDWWKAMEWAVLSTLFI